MDANTGTLRLYLCGCGSFDDAYIDEIHLAGTSNQSVFVFTVELRDRLDVSETVLFLYPRPLFSLGM